LKKAKRHASNAKKKKNSQNLRKRLNIELHYQYIKGEKMAETCDIPVELEYSKEHTWVKMEGDIAVVGLTDYAQKNLKDIVFVDLPKKGARVETNGNLAVVKSVKSVSDVLSPVTGTIEETNIMLEKSPELINNEPYVSGWIAKIKIENRDELKNLIRSEEYEDFINDAE
jgi:glycine cleavage system H protein